MNIQLPPPAPRYFEGLTGIGLGLLLLGPGLDSGFWFALLAVPVGAVALASGLGLFVWPGDSRLAQFMALASPLALVPAFLAMGQGHWLLALSVGGMACLSWWAAGRVSLAEFPRVEAAPAGAEDAVAALKISTDQALLAWFKLLARTPREAELERVLSEFEDWESLLSKRRRRKLEAFHPKPPDLLKVEGNDRRLFGTAYRHIRWPSGFSAAEELPGRARWQALENNQTAHAWVLEHPGKPRPWLLTIHGFRMGMPWLDLRAFEPEFLHRRLGLNIASMVLPLHGPRGSRGISGSGYLDGDFSAFIHASCQAQWDLRRLLSYLRLNRHAPAVGVYGLSLGGYNTALLSGLDKDLSCAVAGIPVFSMADVLWRHIPTADRLGLEQAGLDAARVASVFQPVSPQAFPARLPGQKLGIFAGSVDTLVWPDQPMQLAEHWQTSALHWYSGAHLTFSAARAHRDCLLQTLEAGGLLGSGQGTG